jgi:hypothetical protein
MLAALLALAACFARAPWDEAPPAAIALVATASRDDVGLLEEFEVTVDLFRRADLPTEFRPKVPEGFAGSVSIEPERELGHGFWRRARLPLRRTGECGDVTIEPFSAQSDDKTASAQSDPIRIRVRPALMEGDGTDVEEPSPLLASSEPMPWRWPVAIALAALLLGGIAFAALRGRRSLVLLPIPKEPAHLRALRELARLRAAPRTTPSQVDAYYVGVSHALRVYLEERFSLRAPERTTEEFLAEVERGGPLTAAHCIVLKQFLSQCDLVKFALHSPTEAQHMEAMAIAETFVMATQDHGVAQGIGGGA